ncbi:MAG: thymidylate kinase [Paenibacillaceae bacterium]|nr:thymidylate kinase [Paenibacillaceae bacterium]
MAVGWFITLEGGEGAGKTSIIRQIEIYLQNKGMKVLVTREPGGIDIAEQIRSIVLNTANVSMDSRTEALLYAAARRQHLVEKVIPALNQGVAVLSDRYVDSSLVYQGFVRGLGIDEVYTINRFATEDMMPDVTFWLDVDPQTGIDRIHADKQRELNRLDLEGQSFHYNVREGYRIIHARFPDRIVRIDADLPLAAVVTQVQQELDIRLQAGKDYPHVK